MRLPKFEYFEPEDLKEAVSILQNEPSAKVLAGGTDLLVNMKHRVECPAAVVNLKGIDGLDYIKQENGAVRIGALTNLKRLYMTPMIVEKLPGLAEAAEAVGSYHHQAMGSLAGNICQQNRCKFFNQSLWWRSSRPTCYKAGGEICHVMNKKEICYASYCGDVAPALLVLNARIVLDGPEGEKEIALEDLFSGDGKEPLNLRPGDILTEVIIPATAMDGVSSYTKFANRDSIDFPILGTAHFGHRWTINSIGLPLPLWIANPSGHLRLKNFWMEKISVKKTLKRPVIWRQRKPNRLKILCIRLRINADDGIVV